MELNHNIIQKRCIKILVGVRIVSHQNEYIIHILILKNNLNKLMNGKCHCYPFLFLCSTFTNITLQCYSSIIGFIFHDIHATIKTIEYHIFFILFNNNHCNTSWKLPLVQYSHFQIHQCPNTQQDRKEPTSMRSKIHLHAKLSPHHCTHISESNNHSTIVDVLHLKKLNKQTKQH